MKFILVNHRSPLQVSTCTECERPLDTGYLREVSSQRQYCDYECYLRDEARTLFMPWLSAARDGNGQLALWPMIPYAASFELLASFAAATCWYSISLAKTAVRVSELMATEGFGPFSGRR
jgi:hypothetical protein